MFYFRHDNMKACTAAGLALVSKGLARTEGSGTDKYLVLVDTGLVAVAAESPQSTSHVS